jgi:2-amino-4-hydroxy-6-hydroxymethyldihydropteridine diphosphokinase
MINVIYLCLGSNIGNRALNIISAILFLQKSFFINITNISSIYETSPVKIKKQRKFYNVVVKANTCLSPHQLLSFIKYVEKYEFNRKEVFRFGPRTIDIDILFFNEIIVNSDILVIPHKEIHNRLFVLIPLNEIIPKNFIHPLLKKKVSDILYNSLKILKSQKVKIVKCEL